MSCWQSAVTERIWSGRHCRTLRTKLNGSGAPCYRRVFFGSPIYSGGSFGPSNWPWWTTAIQWMIIWERVGSFKLPVLTCSPILAHRLWFLSHWAMGGTRWGGINQNAPTLNSLNSFMTVIHLFCKLWGILENLENRPFSSGGSSCRSNSALAYCCSFWIE